MKLTIGFSLLLKKIIEGNPTRYGLFSGSSRKIVDQFISDGALDYQIIGNQQKKIFCPDVNNLRNYLHHKYEIPSLEDYIAFLEKEDTSRSDAVKAASNSKHKNIKIFEGFLINSYEEINGSIAGKEFKITPHRGSFIFINDYKSFLIPEDITVVGIEGFENFKEIELQRYLFEDIKPLFLWRYQNSISIASWLQRIPNNYLHFGDFDPKGLHIYLSEFFHKIESHRCRFFVPDDLESLLIRNGEKALFENQIEYLRNIDFEKDVNIVEVFRIINKQKKGLAQEALIPNKS